MCNGSFYILSRNVLKILLSLLTKRRQISQQFNLFQDTSVYPSIYIRHIRNDVLGRNPLHINQHAYQLGKSTDTALNSVVSTNEKEPQTHKIALGAFLDIEGAFDRTSIEAISSALGFYVFLRDGLPTY